MFPSLDRANNTLQPHSTAVSIITPKKKFPLSILALMLAIFFVALTLVGLTVASAQASVSMSPVQDSSQLPPRAIAAMTYIYPSGSCNTTLQACINGATAGDTIQILAGTITESLTLNKAVSLIGVGPYATILKAPPSQRVLTVSGSVTPSTVISGLMFTGGNAVSGLDYGGGIYLITPAQPLLAGLVISNNHATTGGGIATDMPVQMINSIVYGNVATAGGGGLRGPANLTDTQFISNTGSGGGLWTMGPVTILRGHFKRNTGNAQGGALVTFSDLVMTDTEVVSNTSTSDAGGVQSIGLGTTLISGGYFTGNQGLNGGALDVYRLTFSGTVFAGNTSTSYGGAINSGLWVSGQNGRFVANHALGSTNGKGGAIYVAGAMTLTNLVIVSNTAVAEGGGIFSLAGGRLTGGYLQNNSSPGYGGGMSLDSFPSYPLAILNLSGTNFVSNTAYYGGGLYIYQPAVITGGTFTRNSAGSGGGIEIDDNVALSGTSFISNTANNGGGLYVYQGAAVITGGTFIRNLASGSGGGADIDTYGLIASGTVFSGNIAASSQGGGAWVQGGVTITGGHFEANHSGNDGGGLYSSGSLVSSVLSHTDFISNSAVEDGGGLYISGQAVLRGGRFERNTAQRYAGGWYINYATTLTDTVTVSNTATWGGGGYADGGAELYGVQFAGNTATSGGGGGLYSLGQTDVTASRVTGNNALQGGGLYFWGGGTIVNSLLTDNQANAAGADLYVNFHGDVSIVYSTLAAATLNPRQAIVLYSSSSLHVTDTILSNYAVGISVTTGSTAFENYNLFYGNTANSQGSVIHGGNSLIGQNPLFVNPTAGDYHLTVASPAIDHGTNVGIQVDYDGDTRPLGFGYDIGFDERLGVTLNNKVYLPLVLKNH